ncbi:hypothetical protein IscW_ISCW010287 [Ixodes scapularis]|uniref:Uncharacterized protein n=1 Tax=Ixodes scapularis TaxID=6945 RepID=B7Q0U1_IXOSC|nr:hypothetical protein IscW_ISCW010287 [Ixodes scapularis]|eukprot:XP_002408309.1 hypothetical protein IscW_ISCW010287 [Ixodes scapularis]
MAQSTCYLLDPACDQDADLFSDTQHSWVDGRLNLSRLAGADRPVQIPKHLLERLWRPRLVFSPAKAIRILSSHLEETHRTVVSPDQIITVSHK